MLIQEDPPTSVRGPQPHVEARWSVRLRPARRQPGVWFRLPGEWARSTATHIKQGFFSGVEEGEYETTSRPSESPGRRTVYVRYVGVR